MPQSIQQFFTQQALYLRDGRLDLLVRAYAKPLVVILPEWETQPILLPRRRDCEAFFSAKMDGLAAAGIEYLRSIVPQSSTDRAGRIVADVTWYYLTEVGRRAGETEARYFVTRRDGQFRVEMIAFDSLAMPAIATWLADAGRPGTSADI